ncbi:DNA polymerase III subunit gamma/tau [Parasphingorhabdus sp.]|uniref:DNA polymerase III subunit gamma/tau n=1 Tax=Parasphingorhabdus sp. TaxID=2709688 RepID=UPI003002AF8F
MSDSQDIFAAGGVEAPEQPAPGTAQPYRVLARKYRPSKFSELIGQDAMVQTLANAIKRDRLAHAFLMTGVRGVGKTSTARLIAKALNCIGEDGQGGPTIDPCGQCEPCRSIAEGSFIDVIEMDAASHTGVDDVREIIEAVRYSSVSARYKIYIIDEVHMLSKNAFNALLKTLEEPPPHVKFIFATTEVNKVPITVLSRCQRFDLKRISAEQLSSHFGMIVGKEGVTAEQEALDLIAQAAEGSVRDGLSILDQAIAHADMDGDGQVKAVQIRDMLGLSDRSAVRRLFAKLLEGDSAALLDAIAEQYKIGVEPLSLMNGLLSLSHQVTLFKVGRASDPTLSDSAKQQFSDWAEQLSYPVLHRLWQLLLKGYQEVQQAHLPREACEMALLRVLCAGDMPDPGKLAKMLEQGMATTSAPEVQQTAPPQPIAEPAAQIAPPPVAVPEPQASALPNQFSDVVKTVGRVSAVLESILIADMRLISLDAPNVVYQPVRAIGESDIRKITDALRQETGQDWKFTEGQGEAQPSLVEREQQKRNAERQAILDAPLVKAAFEAFPDAQLLEDEDPRPQESRSA